MWDWQQWYARSREFVVNASDAVISDAITVVTALFVGWVIHVIVVFAIRQFVRPWKKSFDEDFITRLKAPLRILFPLLAVLVVMPRPDSLPPGSLLATVRHLLSLAIILAAVFFLLRLLVGFEEFFKRRYSVETVDNYSARQIQTQVTLLRRTAGTFVVVVGIAVALMSFPVVRELGTGILASAGLAGLAVGLAARPVLENLIAGIQIALTQPFSLDDVVIVEGEWGRIEEIAATYVVVKVWDERRLIVPFGRLMTQPFQNWTRRSAQILGTVFLYADYRVPVEKVREKLISLVEANENWDGRVCGLQVTNATDSTVELRALMSAANSSNVWNLRVLVREKLIEFLQQEYPDCLPRSRIELTGEGPPPRQMLAQNRREPPPNA